MTNTTINHFPVGEKKVCKKNVMKKLIFWKAILKPEVLPQPYTTPADSFSILQNRFLAGSVNIMENRWKG